MLRINNRGYKRSYVYGGSGIFDSIAKAAVSLLPVGKEAVKRVATEAGKKFGEKGVQKVSSLISRSRDKPPGPSDLDHSSAVLTSKSEDILRKYTAPPPPPMEENFNLNALIAGSAIRIEDYIKRCK